MARAGRRVVKSSTTSANHANTSQSTTSLKQPSSALLNGPPAPFTYAPVSLRPLVQTLPTTHVYLIHLDNTSIQLKKRVFSVPVFLNIIILAIICIRAKYAIPHYLQQIITILGYQTSFTVNTKETSTPDLATILLTRTLSLMLDYAIFGVLGSWPREFVFGSGAGRYVGPIGHRRAIGFLNTEITIRRGRKWDTILLNDSFSPETLKSSYSTNSSSTQTKQWTKADESALESHIKPAMEPSYLAKSGYMLLDKDWDLDFRAMKDAHRFVDQGQLTLSDLDGVALLYYNSQWIFWRIFADQSQPTDKPPLENSHSTTKQTNQDLDPKIRRFKDYLTKNHAEDVFFRWIEIVQFESSSPDGFTDSKKANALKELTKLLQTYNLNIDEFWDEIGGTKGVPGLD